MAKKPTAGSAVGTAVEPAKPLPPVKVLSPKKKKKRNEVQEKLFRIATDTNMSIRGTVKALRDFPPGAALAVSENLCDLMELKEATDHHAKAKVLRSKEQIDTRLAEISSEIKQAGDDHVKIKELKEAASLYAATHASVAAMQAWRALGGSPPVERLIRQRIVQALGSLGAE